MIKKMCYFIFAIIILYPSISLAKPPLKFSIVVQENTLLFRLSQAILKHISEQIQVPISLQYLPAKRASYMLKEGKIDAEVSRVDDYLAQLDYAIMVDEPIGQFPIYAYSADKKFAVDGWKSLLPYRIVTINGWLYTQKNLKAHRTVKVDSPVQAFRVLKAGRADVFTIGLYSANGILDSSEFDRGNIFRLEPAVTSISTYTYFHIKHTAIAKAYTEALKKMKREGIYHKILLETR